MNVYKTAIDGVVIIEPRVFEDARGYFFESFSQREFDEKVTSQFSTFNSPLEPRSLATNGTQESSNLTLYSLYASLTPAKAVGGDFYDYFERDGRLYFCIGDVSGKGVPAALVMTMA